MVCTTAKPLRIADGRVPSLQALNFEPVAYGARRCIPDP